MKFILLAALVGVCSAGRLENRYLPPSSAQGSGGNGHFLDAPGVELNRGAYNPQGQQNYQQRSGEAAAKILRLTNENNGDGSYRYELETDNGIYQEESGELQNAGTDHEAEVVRGSYSFTAPDGVTYTVRYTADENGFHAEGDHLPTPPPISEAILRSIAQNAAEEAAQSRTGYQQSGPQQQYGPPATQKHASRSGSFSDQSGYKY